MEWLFVIYLWSLLALTSKLHFANILHRTFWEILRIEQTENKFLVTFAFSRRPSYAILGLVKNLTSETSFCSCSSKHATGVGWSEHGETRQSDNLVPRAFEQFSVKRKMSTTMGRRLPIIFDWFRLSLASSLYGASQVTRRQDHFVEIWRS